MTSRYPPRYPAPAPKDKRYILNAEEEAFYRNSRRVITPSTFGQEYWEDRWDEGETFSRGQLRTLAHMGFDPATLDRLEVIVAGDPRRVHFPGHVYFHRRILCPVIGTHGDRLVIISPSGVKKHVYPDGSLTRPKARRWA